MCPCSGATPQSETSGLASQVNSLSDLLPPAWPSLYFYLEHAIEILFPFAQDRSQTLEYHFLKASHETYFFL